ncbi:MAG: transcriptional repressor LexA [Oligoflexia bacterium]|nr:transcriptional repressor LexA [Oligoflexia bacterium]
MGNTPLTPKEMMILEFIKDFWKKKGHAPSYEEIKSRFGFASFFSVQRYLKQLELKGYVRSPWGNKKRALEIVDTDERSDFSLPLVGRVAAGRPIEAIQTDNSIDVPQWMVQGGPANKFALEVRGQSMIEDGIHDGDIIVVQKQSVAHNGQTVVALVDDLEATVKRFYKKGDTVELRPANPEMKSIYVPTERVSINGVVVGLIRKFR